MKLVWGVAAVPDNSDARFEILGEFHARATGTTPEHALDQLRAYWKEQQLSAVKHLEAVNETAKELGI